MQAGEVGIRDGKEWVNLKSFIHYMISFIDRGHSIQQDSQRINCQKARDQLEASRQCKYGQIVVYRLTDLEHTIFSILKADGRSTDVRRYSTSYMGCLCRIKRFYMMSSQVFLTKCTEFLCTEFYGSSTHKFIQMQSYISHDLTFQIITHFFCPRVVWAISTASDWASSSFNSSSSVDFYTKVVACLM